jgi:C4-type Zn-finger protein
VSVIVTARFFNSVSVRGGRVAAICQTCGRRSRSTKPLKDGEPDMFAMGHGWSSAPYPADFPHDDGSVGSTFTCPKCNERLRSAEALQMRAYDPSVRCGTVRRIA